MENKVPQDEPLPTPTEAGEETVDLPEGIGFFHVGQVLGERYEILDMLGRGGMGEVWRAFDLKLRVEVALKALREDLFRSGRRLEMLRQEVRAAREVVSPNVCRIFDLHEIDGRELVSMEYINGATLLGELQERGPLELKEAQDIASQFLSGLEAIHKAGLVHRDVKPENIMLTRAGRVVVMDFGLARGPESGAGSVSGTPAYMAPEHAAGQDLDARADVYSAGVVLAEMVSPEGIRSYQSRQSVWEGVRSEPVQVPDSPWAPVIKRAVTRDRERRQHSAYTLIRELEDVTLRVEGADDLHPYPGLASFTEKDAEYFFGREAEVEQMWRKLEGPPRMLTVAGPSGAGKTSFLQAGLVPHAPPGWGIVRCTPGTAPVNSIAGALAAGTAGDPDAVRRLLRFNEPDVAIDIVSTWRGEHQQALLIVDQFEELFTLNPPEVQQRVAQLLGRLVLDSDIFVVLSLRDDFLYQYHRFEGLRPGLAELTMLGPPEGGALRRALVQPAATCGYRFEDDELVGEMLTEVEDERGALPLLAFAAARLWEKRDRGTGLLTRQAYHDIGGVGGALARHAEATVDRIGVERIPIVRELFRNLVTAEGTRAVREWDELLSVFRTDARPKPETPDRQAGMLAAPKPERLVAASFQLASPLANRGAAEEVLHELINARLLTSYEVREGDEAPTRRGEIIHESLLASWPRLQRWLAQDAEGVLLRDQLRQAARTWDEHDRSDDMLWTGAAYREFAVWRERYPGGLSGLEEAFARAMSSLATRRRRRRRIATVAALALTMVVAMVFATLWRRSVLETRRAEAAKLLALAQVQIETGPTEALAFATASLELSDTPEARIFALRSLWAGPPLRVLNLQETSDHQFREPTFSPDGRWLAVAGLVSEFVLVYGEHGGEPIALGGHAVSADGSINCRWSRDGLLVTGHDIEGRARVWEIPGGRLVREIQLGGAAFWQVADDRLVAVFYESNDPRTRRGRIHIRSWGLRDGGPSDLGELDWTALGADSSRWAFDHGGEDWIYSRGDSVHSRPLPVTAAVPGKVIARHSANDAEVWSWRRGEGIFSNDAGGEIILWNTEDGTSAPGRRLRQPETATTRLFPDPSGRWAVENPGGESRVRLWDLAGRARARPLELLRSARWYASVTDFHPHGDWLVATTNSLQEVSFWPLNETSPTVVEGYDTFARRPVAFTPDGKYLVTNWGQDRVRLWPLPGSERVRFVDLMLPRDFVARARTWLAIDP
ncbi:MAG: WD40 repeat domain-containing serine/threonine protein kinase, partial [Acidobacteriota bacterium]